MTQKASFINSFSGRSPISGGLLLLIPLFLILVAGQQSQAKVFRNSYIQFELPPRWDCQLEGTEWVCRNSNEKEAPEAIIVLTAKEVGPSDTVEQYEAHLKVARTMPGPGGQPQASTVKHVRQRQIGGINWVDGLHMSSEVPNYYTRYLGAVKQKIAVLVTFSAHQRFYTKYSTDFFNAIESLKIVASPDLFGTKNNGVGAGSGEVIGPGGSSGPMGFAEDFPDESKGKKSDKEKLFIFGILVAAIGGYLILKRRKKNKS
jgi:hypothetical protein